jgi:predicted RND superfamily exporter protein
LTDPATFKKLQNLEQDFTKLNGISKVDSLLSAQVIKSEADDIVVSSIIPGKKEGLTSGVLKSLALEIPRYPELQPYINSSMDTLLFYVYFGNNTATVDIDRQLGELQKGYAETLPFDYTGRAPILAKTEQLLTKDIMVFFPILILLVMVVFLSFRNRKAIALSWGLLILSVGSAYFFIHFLGIENSPLILLVPVFGMGLLSDYIIHYFYHLFYEPSVTDGHSVRRRLLFPLSLTVLSTLTGFLSLVVLDGTGHLQLGSLISASIVLTFFGVFLWFPYLNFERPEKKLLPRFKSFQTAFFRVISRHRLYIFILLAVIGIWGMIQIPNLKIEPYPIEQLPRNITVKKADTLINETFFGTVPYFIEIDTGEKNGVMTKDAILAMDKIHTSLEENESVGYAYSLLTVLKRMNYFFQGSEESLLTDSSFDDIYPMLIEQYLLYYSSSVDPLEYESLLDSSYRFFSIKGMVYYKNVENLNDFKQVMEEIEKDLPPGWNMTVHGMIDNLREEQKKLQYNWILSFLLGSVLIFLTVLIFYRNIRLALLSLVPAIFSMIFSFGIIASASLSIDSFSIIFVAIITGLVIDYSIHTLAAIESIKKDEDHEKGYDFIVSYSGIPIFLSFLTSLFSFSVLFLSSFRGARNLGLLLITSLLISYFLSMYLLPLLALPHKKIDEVNHK